MFLTLIKITYPLFLKLTNYVYRGIAVSTDKTECIDDYKLKIATLEQLLANKTQALETTIKQLEATNAQLQASHTALQEKTEQQTTLLSAVTAFVFFKDRSLNYIAASKSLTDMLGIAPHELPGKNDYDFFPKEQAEWFRNYDRQVMESGQAIYNLEESYTDTDGKIKWALTTKIPYCNVKGDVIGMVGTSLDITERKQTEELLKRTNDELEQRVQDRTAELLTANKLLKDEIIERTKIEEAFKKSQQELQMLANVIEQSTEAVVITDLEGNIIYVNPHFEKITGYTANEAIGKNPRLLKSGYHTQAMYQDLWTTIIAGKVWQGQLINKRKNDSLYYEEVFIFPIMDQNKNITNYAAVKKDITDRVKTEEKLKEREKLFRTIAENYPNAYLSIIDKDLTIGFTAGQEFTKQNLDATQFVGLSVDDVFKIYGEDIVTLIKEIYLKTFKGKAVSIELPIGDQIQRYNTVPLNEENGDIQKILVVVENITRRKQIELEKESLFAKVSQQREKLRALTGRLAEIQEAERQKLARQLHDQMGRNLTALSFNLNFVRTQLELPAPDYPLIFSSLENSSALVEEATEHTRDVMADLYPPVLKDYGLVAALRWYSSTISNRVNFNVVVNGSKLIPRLLPPIENTLFRITQEALTNVVKHANASQVNITIIENNKQGVQLIITDNGTGFELDKLNETHQQRGWGLISMTERANAIGATCQIKSNLGQGTKVILEIKR